MSAKSITFTNLRRGLREWGDLYVGKLQAQMRIDRTDATGETSDSIEADVRGTNLVISSRARGNVSILEAIDKGTKGANYKVPPPWHMIVKWMKAKGIRPKRSTRYSRATEAAYERSAKLIAEKIMEKGTIKRYDYKGSGILDYTYNTLEQTFNVVVMQNGYARDVDQYLDKNIKPVVK